MWNLLDFEYFLCEKYLIGHVNPIAYKSQFAFKIYKVNCCWWFLFSRSALVIGAVYQRRSSLSFSHF